MSALCRRSGLTSLVWSLRYRGVTPLSRGMPGSSLSFAVITLMSLPCTAFARSCGGDFCLPDAAVKLR